MHQATRQDYIRVLADVAFDDMWGLYELVLASVEINTNSPFGLIMMLGSPSPHEQASPQPIDRLQPILAPPKT